MIGAELMDMSLVCVVNIPDATPKAQLFISRIVTPLAMRRPSVVEELVSPLAEILSNVKTPLATKRL